MKPAGHSQQKVCGRALTDNRQGAVVLSRPRHKVRATTVVGEESTFAGAKVTWRVLAAEVGYLKCWLKKCWLKKCWLKLWRSFCRPHLVSDDVAVTHGH